MIEIGNARCFTTFVDFQVRFLNYSLFCWNVESLGGPQKITFSLEHERIIFLKGELL
jgi:hypothetical protein